jgi:ribosomal protein L30/L7E
MPAPVAMFVFNRPLHTQKTLEALKLNRLAAETELFVFCDGPRSSAEKEKTDAVRALVKKAHGFKSVTVWESD